MYSFTKELYDLNGNIKFKKLNILGSGGFGDVYLVEDVTSHIKYVAKVPSILSGKSNKELNQIKIKKIYNEYNILERIRKANIKNIVSVYKLIKQPLNQNQKKDLEGIDNIPILILEFVEGITLEDYVLNKPTYLEERKVIKILVELAKTLKEVHRIGIIHRDLKPANILVNEMPNSELKFKIIDFGISSYYDTHTNYKKITTMSGTMSYSAPEQMEQGIISPSSDVFSLGAVGFFLLTKKDPHARAKFDPSEDRPDVSKRLSLIIKKATWPDYRKRFPLMEDFISILVNKNKDQETYGRIIYDGKSFELNKPLIKIGRKIENNSNNNNIEIDIAVQERCSRDHKFISKLHCVIERKRKGLYILKDRSKNGTYFLDNRGIWSEIPKQGLILYNRFWLIALGYSKHPTVYQDRFGNNILNGPYRVIEYRPPQSVT
ncbi:MAG: protein kinase domain-containing protein [Promethearchaeota archaeon]